MSTPGARNKFLSNYASKHTQTETMKLELGIKPQCFLTESSQTGVGCAQAGTGGLIKTTQNISVCEQRATVILVRSGAHKA